MSRSRRLNKRMDDLFPVSREVVFRCSCGWSKSLEYSPLAALLYEQCPECGDDLGRADVYTTEQRVCRVCGEPASGNRTRYCSERCSDLASAVQRMFSWNSVRKRILARDDHTCQHCGADVSEGSDATPEVDHITPVSEDGHPFDERNLITLCGDCHGEKTHGDLSVTSEDAPGLSLGEYLD